MAAPVVFGSNPIPPAVSDKLSRFDFILRQGITQSGIYSVSVITPDSGIFDYLIEIEAFTARDLIYSHADFAAKVSNGLPGLPEAKNFLIGAVAMGKFSWNAAGTSAFDNHQQRVIGRLLMVIHSCMGACKDPVDVSADDDSPMTNGQHESCELRYKALYGEQMEASQLVCVGMLGKIARGLATRNLPAIRLSSVYSQTDDRARAEDSALFMDGSGALKKRQKTVKIPTPSAFIERLSLLLFSVAFVAVQEPAPADKWSGDPEEGVVASTRLQLSRSGVQRYIHFWNDQIRASSDVAKLVELESKMRSLWNDPFRRHRSLQCCMLDSVKDFQGVVTASLAYVPPTPIKALAGKLGDKLSKVDYAQLPGFDPDISTVKKTKDGKQICKFYNIPKGCNFGASCKSAHVCDVKMPDGSACGSTTHIRTGHKRAGPQAEPAPSGAE